MAINVDLDRRPVLVEVTETMAKELERIIQNGSYEKAYPYTNNTYTCDDYIMALKDGDRYYRQSCGPFVRWWKIAIQWGQ